MLYLCLAGASFSFRMDHIFEFDLNFASFLTKHADEFRDHQGLEIEISKNRRGILQTFYEYQKMSPVCPKCAICFEVGQYVVETTVVEEEEEEEKGWVHLSCLEEDIKITSKHTPKSLETVQSLTAVELDVEVSIS